MRRSLTAALAALSLAACDSSTAAASDADYSSYGDEAGEADEVEFDDDQARLDAEQEVADEGYEGPCTIDCSGHDAGFEWAAEGHEDGGISSSPSFDEGQEAYEESVEERLEEKRQEFESEGTGSDYAL